MASFGPGAVVSDVEQSEPLVGDSEFLGPGPVLEKAQQHLAGPMHEAPGGIAAESVGATRS